MQGSRGTWLGFKQARFRKRRSVAVVWAVLLIRCAKPQPRSRARYIWTICSNWASNCTALWGNLSAINAALPWRQTEVIYIIPLHYKYILRKPRQYFWCADEFLLPRILNRSDNAGRASLFDNSLYIFYGIVFSSRNIKGFLKRCLRFRSTVWPLTITTHFVDKNRGLLASVSFASFYSFEIPNNTHF